MSASWERRGATIAFNFLHPDGDVGRFLHFAAEFVDLAGTPGDLPERRGC